MTRHKYKLRLNLVSLSTPQLTRDIAQRGCSSLQPLCTAWRVKRRKDYTRNNKHKHIHLQDAKSVPLHHNTSTLPREGSDLFCFCSDFACVFISVDIRVANEALSCHKGLTANRCLLLEVWTCCDEEART